MKNKTENYEIALFKGKRDIKIGEQRKVCSLKFGIYNWRTGCPIDFALTLALTRELKSKPINKEKKAQSKFLDALYT